MHLVVIGISVGLFISGVFSLWGGQYSSFVLEVVPLVVLVMAKKLPESSVLQKLSGTVSPVPKKGMLRSRLSAECAFFYAKIAFVFVAVFLTFEHFDVQIDMSDMTNPVVLLVYLIPLATMIILVISAFYGLKYLYIKFFRRDAVFCISNDASPNIGYWLKTKNSDLSETSRDL